MVRMQTIIILRLFWHRRNISLKVLRKIILTAEIAENPSFSAAPPRTRSGSLQCSRHPLATGEGLAALPKNLSPLGTSGLDVRPFRPPWPFPQKFLDPPLTENRDKPTSNNENID